MPDLRPFRGFRYSDAARARELTCPPYDVISPDEQRALHERHEHNAVRLELAAKASADVADRYGDVRGVFDAWVAERVLERDDDPSFYVYRQDFRTSDGATRQVTGVMGALALEEFGTDSGVLPHEATMAGPKADRLALLRALRVNVSPIYGIYRGGGALADLYAAIADRAPTVRFEDGGGVLHRMWRITAAAELEVLAAQVARQPLVIADGHHRYETALAYHREQVASGASGDHDAILCFCVDADSEGLVVLPYNRAIRSETTTGAQAADILQERFGGRNVTGRATDALSTSSSEHPFVFVFADRQLLVEVDDEQVVAVTGPRHPAWRALDVVALHEVVLPEVFGESELRFSKDPDEVLRLVRDEGWTAGVLLRALSAADVVDVASSGERMPQKASYFWPKAVTGLVFREVG